MDEFRLAVLRLERAIGKKDWEIANKQTHRLRAFLEGQTGEYLVWLGEIERRSIIDMTKKTEKKGDSK